MAIIRKAIVDGVEYEAYDFGPRRSGELVCPVCVAHSVDANLCDALHDINDSCHNKDLPTDNYNRRIFWQTPVGYAKWRLTK